ncbi:hypothetical protein N665_0742s0011 [Sinapis alba]|nr:hypothetical protein N665_0742s0011 [Sinapis alba]
MLIGSGLLSGSRDVSPTYIKLLTEKKKGTKPIEKNTKFYELRYKRIIRQKNQKLHQIASSSEFCCK